MQSNYFITGKINTYGDFFRYSTSIRKILDAFNDKPQSRYLGKASDILSRINNEIAERIAAFVLGPDDYALYSSKYSCIRDKRTTLVSEEERAAKVKNIDQNLENIVTATEMSKIPKDALELEVLDEDKYILEETIAIAMKYLGEHLRKVAYVKKK